jgi:hypothetical protein
MYARARCSRSGGTSNQPSRQPTMLKYLEKLLTISAFGSNSSMQRAGPT